MSCEFRPDGSFGTSPPFLSQAMGPGTERTPKVAALARRGDIAGLVEAAEHTDVRTGRDGSARDPGARVRQTAIETLAEMDARDATDVIVRALADPWDDVRCAAIRALYDWGEAVPIAEAVAWLPAEAPSRSMALAAITKLADPASAPVLAISLVHGTAQAGLWEEELEVVALLCKGNGRRGPLAQVLDVLVEALAYRDEDVSGRAEDFLLWLGPQAARAVTASLDRSTAPHRTVWILGQIGGEAALEPLLSALDHADPRARAEACTALGDLRDPIAVEPLLDATRDSSHAVRVKAAAALDRLGTVGLIGALAEEAVARAAASRLSDAAQRTAAALR